MKTPDPNATPPARHNSGGAPARPGKPDGARARLLGAATTLIRSKGYAATTVDELCASAGVTKGAFFHHFPTKEALGVAAAEHWSASTGAMFAAAAFHQAPSALSRVLEYLDLRHALIDGPTEAFTCVAGTMAQETYLSSPAIRDACGASILGHAGMLEADLAAAIAEHGVAGVDARGLALHAQAVIQGAFILAKATGDAELARDSVRHLRRYIELLFAAATPAHPRTKGETP
jgi:TetR/AcrR family transcriptional repressor of nem operon